MLVALAGVGFCLWLDARPQFAVRRLDALLAELKAREVHVWRSQSWCRCFKYARGAFLWSTHESTCGLFPEKGRPFDAQAEEDFDAVRAAVRRARVPLNYLTVHYEQGRLVEAEFSLATGLLNRESYFYSLKQPVNEAREVWFRPLAPNWYLRYEDWN